LDHTLIRPHAFYQKWSFAIGNNYFAILALSRLLKQMEFKRHRAIHSIMGQSFYVISRLSERLAHRILLKGYKAEKAFLQKVNSEAMLKLKH